MHNIFAPCFHLLRSGAHRQDEQTFYERVTARPFIQFPAVIPSFPHTHPVRTSTNLGGLVYKGPSSEASAPDLGDLIVPFILM